MLFRILTSLLAIGAISARADDFVTKEYREVGNAPFLAGKETNLFWPTKEVAEVFTKAGVDFPAGTFAYYVSGFRGLIVRNTPTNIELVDTLIEGCGLSSPPSVHSRITIALFRMGKTEFAASRPTYEDLRRASGEFWRELSMIEILAKSGTSAKGACLDGGGVANFEKSSMPKLGPETEGVAYRIETVLSPDAKSAESTLAYIFRSESSKSVPQFTVRFEGNVDTTIGKNRIVQLGKVGEFSYALILRNAFDD